MWGSLEGEGFIIRPCQNLFQLWCVLWDLCSVPGAIDDPSSTPPLPLDHINDHITLLTPLEGEGDVEVGKVQCSPPFQSCQAERKEKKREKWRWGLCRWHLCSYNVCPQSEKEPRRQVMIHLWGRACVCVCVCSAVMALIFHLISQTGTDTWGVKWMKPRTRNTIFQKESEQNAACGCSSLSSCIPPSYFGLRLNTTVIVS